MATKKTKVQLSFDEQVDSIIAKANGLAKLREVIKTFPDIKHLKVTSVPLASGPTTETKVTLKYVIPFKIKDSAVEYWNGRSHQYEKIPQDWAVEHVKKGKTEIEFQMVYDSVKDTTKCRFKYVWCRTECRDDLEYNDCSVHHFHDDSVAHKLNQVIGWGSNGTRKTSVKRLTTDMNFIREVLKSSIEAIKNDDMKMCDVAIHNMTMGKAIATL